MAYIFTKEFINSVEKTYSPFERSYIKYLATFPKLEHKRRKLEEIILNYPEDKRSEMINLIRSFEDTESIAYINELYVYGILYKHFSSINVEKPLKCIDNKTPDFFVNNSLAFEVTTLFEQTDPNEYSIIETLDEIESNIKIANFAIKNLPQSGTPVLSEIKSHFLEVFQEKEDSLYQPEKFIFYFSDGVVISGIMYRGNQRKPTVSSVASTNGINRYDTQYEVVLRRKIKSKLKKYKDLSYNNYSLILVIFDNTKWLEEEDYHKILFGEYTTDPSQQMEGRRNVLLRPNKYNCLSALLMKDSTSSDTYFFIKNPYASVRIDPYEEKIIKAFNANQS